MDGGGSTSLAWWDVNSSKDDQCQLLNRPVGNGANAQLLSAEQFNPTERANGNNLGVVVDTPRTTHDANLYLFVDDRWIEKQQGVTRVYNQAQPLDQPELGLLAFVSLRICAAAEPPADQIEFFENRIRPVLVEQCYECHNSTTNAEGGLALDQNASTLQGGDGGAIIVPGKPAESRLLEILRHEVDGLKMPQGGPKLDDSMLADFEKWIRMGAPDPRDKPPTVDELTQATSWEAVFEKRKKWWSLQPVRRVEPPAVKNQTWSEHPVDRFVLAKLEEHGLQPATRADKRTLLRRATFALTGMPPTPDEIHAFLADETPQAFEAVVDRLLDSPRFGERWARHWMDLVRYCESHGSQGDPELPNAYQYRDYLIRAFNADVPYDQLVREHLAGDLLPEPRWNTFENFNESAIGPAHLRMVELGFVPVDALDDQVKVVDNQIDVYSNGGERSGRTAARYNGADREPVAGRFAHVLRRIGLALHRSVAARDPSLAVPVVE